MSVRPAFLIVLSAGLFIAACDRPKGAPASAPVPATVVNSAPALPVNPPRPPEPIVWDDVSGRFTMDGMVLKTAYLWRFDGGIDGFSAVGGNLEPAAGGGLRVIEQALDSVVRSPQTLSIDGARYNGVLIRLTREKASPKWDGSLFYTTSAHGEAAEFHAKPLRGANPGEGETTIMVYDMAELKKGGDDWVSSIITGLRVDLDDSAAGVFRVHQVAVVTLPLAAQ